MFSSRAVTVARRELLSFVVTPIAYAVVTGFVFLSGFFFFTYLGNFNRTLNKYLANPLSDPSVMNLNQWVIELYYHTLIVLLILFVPLLTMRLFSEERRSGMFELLLTCPIRVWDLVLGKALGLAVVVGVLLLTSLSFPTLLYLLSDPKPELAPIFTGFLGLSFCAAAFASIGLAIAALCANALVAGIGTMVALLIGYLLLSPAESVGGGLGQLLLYLSPAYQVRDLIHGVISIHACAYFVSVALFGLWAAGVALSVVRSR